MLKEEVEKYLSACGLSETLSAFRKEFIDSSDNCFEETSSHSKNKSSLAKRYFERKAEISKARSKVYYARKKLAESTKKLAKLELKLSDVAEVCSKHISINLGLVDALEVKVRDSCSSENGKTCIKSENDDIDLNSNSLYTDLAKDITSVLAFYENSSKEPDNFVALNSTSDYASGKCGRPFSGSTNCYPYFPEKENSPAMPENKDPAFDSAHLSTHLTRSSASTFHENRSMEPDYFIPSNPTSDHVAAQDGIPFYGSNNCYSHFSDNEKMYAVSENKDISSDFKRSCTNLSKDMISPSMFYKNSSQVPDDFASSSSTSFRVARERDNPYPGSNFSSELQIISDEELKNIYPLSSRVSFTPSMADFCRNKVTDSAPANGLESGETARSNSASFSRTGEYVCETQYTHKIYYSRSTSSSSRYLKNCRQKSASGTGIPDEEEDLRKWCEGFMKKSNEAGSFRACSSESIRGGRSTGSGSVFSSRTTLNGRVSTADSEINCLENGSFDCITDHSVTPSIRSMSPCDGCDLDRNITGSTRNFQQREYFSRFCKATPGFRGGEQQNSTTSKEDSNFLEKMSNDGYLSHTSPNLRANSDQRVRENCYPDTYLYKNENTMPDKMNCNMISELKTPFWKDKVEEYQFSICSNDRGQVAKNDDLGFTYTIQNGSRSKTFVHEVADEICRCQKSALPFPSPDKSARRAEKGAEPSERNDCYDLNVFSNEPEAIGESYSLDSAKILTSASSRYKSDFHRQEPRDDSSFEICKQSGGFGSFSVSGYFEFEKAITPFQSSSAIDTRVPDKDRTGAFHLGSSRNSVHQDKKLKKKQSGVTKIHPHKSRSDYEDKFCNVNQSLNTSSNVDENQFFSSNSANFSNNFRMLRSNESVIDFHVPEKNRSDRFYDSGSKVGEATSVSIQQEGSQIRNKYSGVSATGMHRSKHMDSNKFCGNADYVFQTSPTDAVHQETTKKYSGVSTSEIPRLKSVNADKFSNSTNSLFWALLQDKGRHFSRNDFGDHASDIYILQNDDESIVDIPVPERSRSGTFRGRCSNVARTTTVHREDNKTSKDHSDISKPDVYPPKHAGSNKFCDDIDHATDNGKQSFRCHFKNCTSDDSVIDSHMQNSRMHTSEGFEGSHSQVSIKTTTSVHQERNYTRKKYQNVSRTGIGHLKNINSEENGDSANYLFEPALTETGRQYFDSNFNSHTTGVGTLQTNKGEKNCGSYSTGNNERSLESGYCNSHVQSLRQCVSGVRSNSNEYALERKSSRSTLFSSANNSSWSSSVKQFPNHDSVSNESKTSCFRAITNTANLPRREINRKSKGAY